MRNVTLKNSLYLLVGTSAVAWFSIAYFSGLDLSKVLDFFGLIPKSGKRRSFGDSIIY